MERNFSEGKFNQTINESRFHFEQKIEHIKTARDNKIADIEQQTGITLNGEDRSKTTLTLAEYDKYRVKQNSLTGNSLSTAHGWNHLLEQAGIPLKTKPIEDYYSSGKIRDKILSFAQKFKTQFGREPNTSDLSKARKQEGLPSPDTIKKLTGLTAKDYFVSLGLMTVRQGRQANEPYRGEEGKNTKE